LLSIVLPLFCNLLALPERLKRTKISIQHNTLFNSYIILWTEGGRILVFINYMNNKNKVFL